MSRIELRKIIGSFLTFGIMSVAQVGWAQQPEVASQTQARDIPAKKVPVPTSLSPELTRVVAEPIQAFPTPKTSDQWRQAQKSLDTARTELTKKLAASTGAKIEEIQIAGVRCHRVTPAEISKGFENRLLVHVHGGAFVLGGGLAGAMEAVLVSNATGCVSLSIDYRMPPDHPFPAALDDVVNVWKELTKSHSAKTMALYGTSAGGGLVLSTIHKLKQDSIPLPAAIFAGTPVSDMTKTGDSYYTNSEICNGLGRYEGFLEDAFRIYAGAQDMHSPLLSPIYGDTAGFPPTLLISGTRDLFLSNTVRMHRKLRESNIPCDLHVYEAQSHADYLKAFDAPESKDAMREIREFFDKHLEHQ